jgi:hypothetical protein
MENLSPMQENARTLSQIVGVDEPAAADMLNGGVTISFDTREKAAVQLAEHIEFLLARTVRDVSLNVTKASDFVEIVLGSCAKQTRVDRTVYVSLTAGQLRMGTEGPVRELDDTLHPALLLMASCYVAAYALRISVLKNVTALPFHDPLVITLKSLPGYSELSMLSPIVIPDSTFLAGAGAIGNSFLWALHAFDVRGTLMISDPDVITPGNLNRCVLFHENDIGESKAATLASEARKILPDLELTSEPVELNKVAERSNRRWLRQLIVAVDSRRARRRLQTEIPGEVYDASTTGVQEIVLHFNKQPESRACLACIYREDADERVHEKHVASALGVEPEDVQAGWIQLKAAKAIASKYINLQSENLVGIAYDTLFKQLCGQQALITDADEQVLAPFAFVSALAGVYLAIEYVLRNQSPSSERFNYWRVSPWAEPNPRAMSFRPRDPECVVCNDPVYNRLARELWQSPARGNG